MEIAAVIILSYLIGSIPTSIIMGKLLKGIDIREHGSGNAGGTNALRVLGWKAGIFTMLLDVFKGFVAAYWISQLVEGTPIWIMVTAGIFAILGHTYTVFAGFKGGKGVGTAAGMLIALFPIAVPICFGVFIITLLSTGIVSLGSIFAATTLPIVTSILKFYSGQDVNIYLYSFSIFIPFFIMYTHRTNIQRLLKGEENRFEKIMIFRKKK